MRNPLPSPQKNHHICIFQWKIASGKSWFGDYPQKDPSLKKDIPAWVFPMVFSTSLRNYEVCTSGSQRSLQCCMSIWRTPRVGDGDDRAICFSFEPRKSRELPHGLNTWIFEWSLYIHWICSRGKYWLSIWDAPSDSNVGKRDFHPLWLGDSKWSGFFLGDVKILSDDKRTNTLRCQGKGGFDKSKWYCIFGKVFVIWLLCWFGAWHSKRL